MTSDIEERLARVDMEIHAILDKLRSERKSSVSIDALSERMRKARISDEESTGMIRNMRDKEYGT